MPFTVVSVTTGSVLSTVMVCAPLVPVLPAVSLWVAVTEYDAVGRQRRGGREASRRPSVQVAVPFCVLAPVIATETVVLTPAAVVQVPPTVVTVAFVVNGKVRAVPLTVVR